MAKLSKDKWQEARAIFEDSALSYEKIAGIFGVSKQAVMKQAKTNGWSRGEVTEPEKKVTEVTEVAEVTDKVASKATNPKVKPSKEDVKKKIGRPTSYKLEYVAQAKKLCMLGAIDSDLADFFGVSLFAIENWKRKYADFYMSIREGKAHADMNMAESLYNSGMGGS